ncbi:PhzF family phenazine biosynthesis protein [Streptomyces sp. NPDC096351]|uniref:PhzF family phenazine biosynthesis protein n=1 Tax=Streptomyces sp. NPDC096351 TaxID=3366087 RepID=UPI0037F7D870
MNSVPETPEVLHYTAFSDDPAGGNPAGIVLDAAGLSDEEMLAIAADVGYSESAFLTQAPPAAASSPSRPSAPAASSPPSAPSGGAGGSAAESGDATEAGRPYTIRYFSPKAEVPFCGHATVATAVALGERLGPGNLVFTTRAGIVPVTVTEQDGALRATLTSVEPHVEEIAPGDLAEALAALDWPAGDLDPAFPPRVAFAGARHLVLAAATRERLADLAYDFARLEALMHRLDLTTVQLVWRADAETFHVRDPFPVGGVVEDPATGAAAAALGGYLRELGLVPEATVLTLHQGEDMGRPGVLTVELRAGDRRIRVSGAGARIPV